MVIIVLLELILADLFIVRFIDQFHEMKIVKDCLEETFERILVHFLFIF
jgi:hypothetical protein